MEEDSWKRLTAAIGFYTVHGFELIEVPWTVNSVYSSLTKPPGRNDFWLKDKVLVASAEQAFVQLYDEGKLDPEKFYCALTPCFRDEPVFDELHQLYFMKLELFKVFKSSADFFKVLETSKL
jgi:seryl-tRNA synthetase